MTNREEYQAEAEECLRQSLSGRADAGLLASHATTYALLALSAEPAPLAGPAEVDPADLIRATSLDPKDLIVDVAYEADTGGPVSVRVEHRPSGHAVTSTGHGQGVLHHKAEAIKMLREKLAEERVL